MMAYKSPDMPIRTTSVCKFSIQYNMYKTDTTPLQGWGEGPTEKYLGPSSVNTLDRFNIRNQHPTIKRVKGPYQALTAAKSFCHCLLMRTLLRIWYL